MDYSKIVDIKHRVENYRAGVSLLDHRGVLSLVDDLWTIIGELLIEINARKQLRAALAVEGYQGAQSEEGGGEELELSDALSKELGLDTEDSQ